MNHLFYFVLLISSCAQGPLHHKKVHHQSSQTKYIRTQWQHWSDHNQNCIDTRGEILIQRSLKAVVMNKKGCKVVKGEWRDYYYPEVHTLASKVDMDHLVPLKYAHDHGAANWDSVLKEKFANDPENLVITNKRYNRQKGAKGIDQWLPVHKDYACKYIQHWFRIKKKYRLDVTQAELETKRIAACSKD
jgi:Protein of unknown function (DUF1524)